MPDPTNPPPLDQLAEIAGASQAEHLGRAAEFAASRSGSRGFGGRGIAVWALRACCAGLFLGGLLPTLLTLGALVAGTSAWMSDAPDPDTPLGRNPVRWRFDQYFRQFPLEVCPLGFAIGFLAWGAADVAGSRAARTGRMPPRNWVVLGLLVVAYLAVVGVRWHSALPDESVERDPSIRYDPIEDDPNVRPLLRAAERDTDEELRDAPRHLGFIRHYWWTKKRILKEKYGIDWRSPAELNPKRAFD